MHLSLALLTGYAALAAADCLTNFDFLSCYESGATVPACSIGFVGATAACSCSIATIASYCAVAYCSGDVTSALTNMDGDFLVTMSSCATAGIAVSSGIIATFIPGASASSTVAAAGSSPTGGPSLTSTPSVTSKAAGNPMVTQVVGRALVAAVGIVGMVS